MTARAAPDRQGPDSAFEASTLERRAQSPSALRWAGLPRRWVALAAALGCLCVLLLARSLAAAPWIDASWRAEADGALVLAASRLPVLAPAVGHRLVAVEGDGATPLQPDALLLQHSLRWQADDALRLRQRVQQRELAALLAGDTVHLRFDDGRVVALPVLPRGLGGLGALFWPLSALALVLCLLAGVVMHTRPQARNGLYLVMCLCQAGNLLFIAVCSAPGLGALPGPWVEDLNWRLTLDALTTAAAVHAFALHPRRLPQARFIACLAWAGAAAWLMLAWVLVQGPAAPLAGLWWWAQAACLTGGAAAWWLLGRSYRLEPNPFALVLQRRVALALAGLLLVTLAIGAAARWPGSAHTVATAGALLSALMLSGPLLLAPFVARSRQVLREGALLAAAVALAATFHLLLITAFSLAPATALTLAALLALGPYAAARQWLLPQLAGRQVLSSERTFEQLYRVAREVQAQPSRYAVLLGQLLHDLFEPLELVQVRRALAQARVAGGGSALVVPLRESGRRDDSLPPPPALLLRFAGHGQRLFTDDDARLADRLVERLRRAVAYDRAVERGRTEERQRIAQDLHDDIGARLLTLMYQAQTPEMEEYIRLTLKDLKTLTRGLAAGEHRLSHAAAEWKADLTQRLNAAQVQLAWQLTQDREADLTMVQWSALTRVLRELVSNALQHAQASRVVIDLSLQGTQLRLQVADDGRGREPQSWSHGLGLSGVRKRVKLLGGEVTWRENSPRGVVCEVRVADFD